MCHVSVEYLKHPFHVAININPYVHVWCVGSHKLWF